MQHQARDSWAAAKTQAVDWPQGQHQKVGPFISEMPPSSVLHPSRAALQSIEFPNGRLGDEFLGGWVACASELAHSHAAGELKVCTHEGHCTM